MGDAADRTIPATPRRRAAARRQGLAPRPHQPAWIAAAVTTLFLLPAWGRATVPAAAEMMREAVARAVSGGTLDAATLLPAAVVLPTLAVIAAASAAGIATRSVLDGGWGLGRAAFDLRRISPAAGLGRIFAGETLLAAAGHAAGLAVIVVAAALGAWSRGSLLGDATATADPARVAAAALGMLWPPLAAAVVVTVVGQLLAWRRFERRLRMTPEEYAEESRGMQADPKIRLLHRDATRRPPASASPAADAG
jgi:flagellar biosynthetic protein FlhB